MCSFPLSLTSALDGVGGQRNAPAALAAGKDPSPIVQEAGWASEPVWAGAENLAHTEIRSPNRPARSESLYRLRYPGSNNNNNNNNSAPRYPLLHSIFSPQLQISVLTS